MNQSKTDTVRKVVLFGPESTGKTVLAKQLADAFGTIWVPEFARCYLENRRLFIDPKAAGSDQICTEADIAPIVLGQIAAEEALAEQAPKLLFCDTNPLQTHAYVAYYYNKQYAWLQKLIAQRPYHLYLLTGIDIPWVPDPLRDRPQHRKQLFDLFESTLQQYKCTYAHITGADSVRLQNSIQAIALHLGLSPH